MPQQDLQLIEKLARQPVEDAPDRIVYANGWGAHGTFTVTGDITCYSCASVFSEVGKPTPVFTRFSTLADGQGTVGTERDVYGFAVKFYTGDGNWDMVGNNTPVFFFRDAHRFPGYMHALKRDPDTHRRSPAALWDFWSRSPEAVHQITMLMSDRGRPRTVRHINGYGAHTFSLLNADNERFWVKFHFKTLQGPGHRTGAGTSGDDPREPAQHDLCTAIAAGDYPRWKLCIQVMPEAEAETTAYNPFDVTKVWPQADYPLIDVGILELNRNPDTRLAEVEQAAFSPANIVPGIGFSPDRMLQARIFAYADAQRYRLGARFEQLPINAAKPAAHQPDKDRTIPPVADGNPAKPGAGAAPDHRYRVPPLTISTRYDAYNDRDGNDDYSQAGALFRLMPADAQARLMDTIAGAMRDVPLEIVRRQLAHFHAADPDYGHGVAMRVGLASDSSQKPQAAA